MYLNPDSLRVHFAQQGLQFVSQRVQAAMLNLIAFTLKVQIIAHYLRRNVLPKISITEATNIF